MSFFITPAYAAGAGQPAGSGYELIIMMVVFAAIFYFMIFRPQSKRAKAQRNLLSSLSKGDEVITSGGLIGRITKINDENAYIQLELSEDTTISIKKDFVSAVLPKGTLKSI